MDNELLKSMFLRSKDQYESSVRWTFIIILICLLFHLMTFSQFVNFGKQLSSTKISMENLFKMDNAVSDLTLDLKGLEKSTTVVLDERINGMLPALKSDFTSLKMYVEQIRTGSSVTVDHRLQYSEQRKEFIIDDKTKKVIRDTKIATTEDKKKLIDELQTIVKGQIVEPTFDQLKTYWRDEALPKIRQVAKSIDNKLDVNQSRFPKENLVWNKIRENVKQTLQDADKLEIQPPANPKWWASVEEKELHLSIIAADAENKLSSALLGSVAIEELGKQVRDSLVEQKKLQTTLQDRMNKAKDGFKEQQKKITNLSKPFGILSFDLNVVVSKFPLLLGIMLAGISIWSAYRREVLASTVDFMDREDNAMAPHKWLIGQMRLSESRMWLLNIILRCLMFCIWIGFATWQLAGWEKVNSTQLLVYTVAGCLAVVAAQVYQWHICRQVIALSKNVLQH